MRNSQFKFRNAGYSILELMISIAIGLIMTTAAGGLYVANKQTYRMQDDVSRLEETSKAAFDTLSYHIRQAGFVDVSDDPNRVKLLLNPANYDLLRKRDTTNTKDMIALFFDGSAPYTGIKAIMGCDGPFSSITSVAPPWACSGLTGASSFIVSYQARPTEMDGRTVRVTTKSYLDTLGVYDNATGIGGDCGAQDVAGENADPQGPLAINLFYVDADTQRLMCVGSGDPTNPRTIADGVEDMLVLYGISPAALTASAPMDAYAARYVDAEGVVDAGTVTGSDFWSKVLSIRICLQIAAPSDNITNSAQTYTDCRGDEQTPSDRKIRQIYWATFSLRNNVLTTPDAL